MMSSDVTSLGVDSGDNGVANSGVTGEVEDREDAGDGTWMTTPEPEPPG